LLSSVRRAREDLKFVRNRLRSEQIAEQDLIKAKKALERASDDAIAARDHAEPAEAEAYTAPRPEQLVPGSEVYVDRLRTTATVVEPASRGRVRIAAGAMKLWVSTDEVRVPAKGATAGVAAAAKTATREPEPALRRAVPTVDNTIDLRGLRVEDALSLLEAALDRLYAASEPVAYVVHGVGSGALRDAVRTYLKSNATYVADVRTGVPEEGGEKLTVVVLR
jgi:DNA mismatch repair protein MutS2